MSTRISGGTVQFYLHETGFRAPIPAIVTTYSDALISELTGQPEAVLACERPGEGTVLRRLDPERLRSLLDDYRLGDLWRIGELGAPIREPHHHLPGRRRKE